MESILRFCAVSVCMAVLSISPAIADASVWSVRSGDNVIYLGGTVHLLRPGDYPLPDEFEEAYQASSLLSLKDLTETGNVIDGMIGAWRSGDAQGLSELFVEDMKVEAPALYDALLLERNLKWIPQIDRMLQDADTEFVLVGAAHIVGENSLLDLLSKEG